MRVASPALSDKVRGSVTEGRGAYRFPDLPAGNYAVTFTLQGFKTVTREDVSIRTGTNGPLDVQMHVHDAVILLD